MFCLLAADIAPLEIVPIVFVKYVNMFLAWSGDGSLFASVICAAVNILCVPRETSERTNRVLTANYIVCYSPELVTYRIM